MARHIKTRDINMVAIISGVTKAGIHRDNRKHANAMLCRKKITDMPAAVIAHAPKCDVVVDWERDNDLFRVYANVENSEGTDIPDIREIHLLDDALQTEAVINFSMFTQSEWDSIYEAVMDEWDSRVP